MARTNQTTYLRGLASLLADRKISYIASQMNIDPSTLYQLVRCKRGASLSMALDLAEYLHTSVEKLASREKNYA